MCLSDRVRGSSHFHPFQAVSCMEGQGWGALGLPRYNVAQDWLLPSIWDQGLVLKSPYFHKGLSIRH